MVSRSTRYQGAIIRDHHILLLKQVEHASGRSYWQIPGGGIESGETEEQCVQREMLEETGLAVRVDSLLLDEPSTPGAIYQRWKTYRCAILAGEARPGSELEAAYADAYSFTDIGWFDLRHPTSWDAQIDPGSFVYAFLQRIQVALGYTPPDFRTPKGGSMNANQTKPASIDDYIATFSQDVQAILEQIRGIIRAAAPDAQETISYGMPTFNLNGRYLVYFAAYKKHIGLYPAPLGVAEFQDALSRYGSGKGTLKFPLDQPMPLDLIRSIVQFHIQEHAKQAAKGT
jgi:uncharacterized protein YdhG (YjbR/CyaY superfamily)/8-oxo-dGTP pyrophosphatase MutT (NUDIX family)